MNRTRKIILTPSPKPLRLLKQMPTTPATPSVMTPMIQRSLSPLSLVHARPFQIPQQRKISETVLTAGASRRSLPVELESNRATGKARFACLPSI